MLLGPSAMTAFAALPTARRVGALKCAGVDTAAADMVLGHLAGTCPDIYVETMVALASARLIPQDEALRAVQSNCPDMADSVRRLMLLTA